MTLLRGVAAKSPSKGNKYGEGGVENWGRSCNQSTPSGPVPVLGPSLAFKAQN